MTPLFLPRAILFDLDGTLADTAPDLAAAMNTVRKHQGLSPAPYDALRAVASAGAAALINVAYGVNPQDDDFDGLRQAFLLAYENGLAVNTTLFAGVPELLKFITAQSIAWGIVTNKPARFTNPLLPKIGLDDALCVISGDTTPFAKPYPEPLLAAARCLQIDPALCWYVGDDRRDVEAARAAGMFSVAITWGYGGGAVHAWGGDCVIDTPMQLMQQLMQL